MTIAVVLMVHDGLVLAADSASTLTMQDPNGQSSVANVYNNANKIVNLVKDLPLGIITWGSGSIGSASMTTIFKDLRMMFTGETDAPDGTSWKIDPFTYTVANVAERVRSYVVDHLIAQQPAGTTAFDLGMNIAGFSAGVGLGEVHQVNVVAGACTAATQVLSGSGITVGGQPQAIARLIFGVDPQMADVLVSHLGVAVQDAPQAAAILQQQLQAAVIFDPMPIQDTLDLAEFLVDVTIKMSRFQPGAWTVGGPIELAAITKHEGFRWIKRKHYFSVSLNG